MLKVNAGSFLDVDPKDLVVTGKINSVENTRFDFREFVRLGDRINSETKNEKSVVMYLVVNDANSGNKKADFKHVAT